MQESLNSNSINENGMKTMNLLNLHLLAILPTLLFIVGNINRYLWVNRSSQNAEDQKYAEQAKNSFLKSLQIELMALSVINGIIVAMLSMSFLAGMAFLVTGVFLAIISENLRSGSQTWYEYLTGIQALLIFYEFIYFLAADKYFRIFGHVIFGSEIALIWFFGILLSLTAVWILIPSRE